MADTVAWAKLAGLFVVAVGIGAPLVLFFAAWERRQQRRWCAHA